MRAIEKPIDATFNYLGILGGEIPKASLKLRTLLGVHALRTRDILIKISYHLSASTRTACSPRLLPRLNATEDARALLSAGKGDTIAGSIVKILPPL